MRWPGTAADASSSSAWWAVTPHVMRMPAARASVTKPIAFAVEMWQMWSVPAKPLSRTKAIWSATEAISACAGRAIE